MNKLALSSYLSMMLYYGNEASISAPIGRKQVPVEVQVEKQRKAEAKRIRKQEIRLINYHRCNSKLSPRWRQI